MLKQFPEIKILQKTLAWKMLFKFLVLGVVCRPLVKNIVAMYVLKKVLAYVMVPNKQEKEL